MVEMSICKECYFFYGSTFSEMGYCKKYDMKFHELGESCDKYLSNEEGNKNVNNLINELVNDMSKKVNSYVIWVSRDENIKLDIVQDIDRPNNPDDYEIIGEYMEHNYGSVVYEVIEADDGGYVDITVRE